VLIAPKHCKKAIFWEKAIAGKNSSVVKKQFYAFYCVLAHQLRLSKVWRAWWVTQVAENKTDNK